MKKVRWAVKMYHDWRVHCHSVGLERISCNLDDRASISATSLRFALCRFITEVKKVDGTDFPGKTLYDILICIQFHLECLGFSLKVINDEAFWDIKYTLDNTMKQHVALGIGLSVRQAEVLSVTDEDYLWSLGFLGSSTLDQLLNTAVFCTGKGFALHAGKEHRALRAIPFQSQLRFMWNSDGEIYLRYTEDIDLKTNKDGIKHKKIEAKTVDLYAIDRPERCPLRVILKYMSLLPKTRTCTAFYLQPRKKYFGKAWYLNRPAGINKLRNVVSDICRDTGLPGHYTNHTLRSGAATKMYQHDLDEQLIMEVTGHRSLAVRFYKRTSERQRKMASKCIFSWHWVIWYVTRPNYDQFLFIVCQCAYCSLFNTLLQLPIVSCYNSFVANNSRENTKGKVYACVMIVWHCDYSSKPWIIFHFPWILHDLMHITPLRFSCFLIQCFKPRHRTTAHVCALNLSHMALFLYMLNFR